MNWRRAVLFVVMASVAIGAWAAEPLAPTTVTPLKFDVSPALRDIAPLAVKEGAVAPENLAPTKAKAYAPEGDPLVQQWIGKGNMPAPIVNFEAIKNDFGVYPPDTQGDVGPNHYIQWVNLGFAIYNKSGVRVYPVAQPWAAGNTLWAGFGGACATSNDGDPITLYDPLSDRWLMSQFALPGPFYQCIAISQTNDPLGAWYRYAYLWPGNNLNDYPKFGVRPDAYYASADQFLNGSSWNGAGVAAFNRAKMLTGDPTAEMIYFNLGAVNVNFGSLLPSDLDGTPPPAGTPNYFAEWDNAGWIPGDTQDTLRIWEFHVDWATPGNSTFGLAGLPNLLLTTANADPLPCVGVSRSCIPQPGTTVKLDSIGDRLMHRLQFRQFSEHQSLVVNHSVDAGGDRAGVRWYELRDTGEGWSIYQQGTYAPADGLGRWMGSVAMDAVGNMAIGYSVSSSTVHPSIRYAGRVAGDPLGEMPQAEGTIIAGTGSQTGSGSRWGDYSMLAVDPSDDCTFWYTTEYIQTTGVAPWQTRVASFKFPSCVSGPSGTLTGTVTNSGTGEPLAGASVVAGVYSTMTNASGVYSMAMAPGTYDVTASKFGYASSTVTGVAIVDGETTTQDFALVATAGTAIDGYVTDSGHGWPLWAKVEVSLAVAAPEKMAAPVYTVFTNPFTGYYDLGEVVGGQNYVFNVTSMYPGYAPAARPVAAAPGGFSTENFILSPAAGCGAAGYVLGEGGVYETFSSGGLPTGWTIVDYAGTGGLWRFDDPGGRGNLTGGSGGFAVADSDYFGTQDMDTALVTPSIDLSAQPVVQVEFDTDYNALGDVADVDVSNNGGSSWTNVWRRTADFRGHVAIDVSALAGGQADVKVRFHYWNAWWAWWWEVDNVRVGETQCEPVPGGMVAGFVTDANTGSSIIGAKVEQDLGGSALTMATPDDPNLADGFYFLYTPIPGLNGPATRTFTASKTGYVTEETQVNVVPNATLNLSFDLDAGQLTLNPPALWSRLYAGQTEVQAMSLDNSGDAEAAFKLTTTPVKTTWEHDSPVEVGNQPGDGGMSSFLRAPQPPMVPTVQPAPLRMLAGPEAYAVDIYPGYNVVKWDDIEVPGTWNVQAGVPGTTYFGGDFVNGDFSTLWVLDYDTNQLRTVDVATGATTTIGSAVPGGGESWTGLKAAPDGTLYASATTCGGSTLYGIDPTTGAATPIGPITNGPCIIDIAINAEGAMYGVDIVNDVFLSIDPATGAGTVIGPTGAPANYAQGMDFDDVSGILYWAAYTTQGELRVIDTATGASTLLGGFPGGAEVDCLAIATFAGGAGLPWLVLDPTEGTVAGNASFPIDATFIADGAPHYGLFRANVGVSHDTPYDVEKVPACFTKAFNDMAEGAFADAFVHALAGARITSGCGGGNFCPSANMTRGVMAVWLLNSKFGPDYAAPPCTGIFSDVPCESTPNATYIEALYNEGITGGCYYNPETGERRYCPNDAVTRAQMAVFLLVAKEGTEYTPPPCVGLFGDVACPSGFAVNWIEELYNRGITAGCGGGNYCPNSTTTRAQMSVFVTTNWDIPYCAAPPSN